MVLLRAVQTFGYSYSVILFKIKQIFGYLANMVVAKWVWYGWGQNLQSENFLYFVENNQQLIPVFYVTSKGVLHSNFQNAFLKK